MDGDTDATVGSYAKQCDEHPHPPRQQPTATAYGHPVAESLTSAKEISRENEMEAADQQPNEGPLQTRSRRVIKFSARYDDWR